MQAITIQKHMKSSRNYIDVTNTCVAQLVASEQKPDVEGFCGELGLGEIEKDGLKVTQVLDASLGSANLGKKVLINQVDSDSTRNQNKEKNIYSFQDIA